MHKNRPTPPVFDEIAASGDGLDLGGFTGEIVPYSDPLLARLGANLKQYESLVRDDQIQSTFQQRRRAVTSKDWEVTPGGDSAQDIAAADFIKEQLAHIKFDRVTDKMLWGIYYGYAVGECLWTRDGNRVVLDQILVRKAGRFRFDRDGGLRLMRRGVQNGVLMPERKFWTFNFGNDTDDDPYGRGLAFWLYWPVFLKRNGIKFWALALEKFGTPTTLGKYPAGQSTDETAKKNLLAAAAAVSRDMAVVIPEGMSLELLEAQRRSGGDHHLFGTYMDGMVAKIVLSQTMTTDVRNDVIKGDSDLICESLSDGPLRWLTEWNFPGAKTPKVWRIIEEEEDLRQSAETDKIIYDMGFRPSEESIQEKYGPGWTLAAQPVAKVERAKNAAFAEAAPDDAIDSLIAALAQDDGFTEFMEPIVGPIEKLVEDSASFEELTGRLAEAIKGMDASKMAEMIARSRFAARLAGEVEADL